MIVRTTSRVQAHDVEGIREHLEVIRSALTGDVRPESRFGPLKALNDIKRLQTGSILIHWPAPAISRVATNFPTLIFGASVLSCFIILFVVSVAAHAFGISPANEQKFGFGTFLRSSSLLFLGHGMLLLIHVLCRLAIYMQLDIVSVEVPEGRPEGGVWRLLDSAIFPTSVATRSWTSSRDSMLLLQFRSFRRNRITNTNAVLLLLLSAAGFICFYVGARASGAFLVGMYVTLFIIANLFKTIVLLRSNKACCVGISEDSLPKYPIGRGMSSFSPNRIWYSLSLYSNQPPSCPAHQSSYRCQIHPFSFRAQSTCGLEVQRPGFSGLSLSVICGLPAHS
jgi:hypothetical protein